MPIMDVGVGQNNLRDEAHAGHRFELGSPRDGPAVNRWGKLCLGSIAQN
jgi:hypothetical protein